MKQAYFALLVCALPTSASAVPVGQRIKVGPAFVKASPKSICVFEWSQGDQQHRYEGWDSCAKMTIRSASAAFLKQVRPRGRDKTITTADIPPGSPAFVIGNGFSEVLVFADRSGEVREILTAD